MDKIKVMEKHISHYIQNNENYISLTDIAKHKSPKATGIVISHWLSTKFTIEFMGLWEKLHNTIFNVTEFRNIKNQAGSHGFILSSKNWITKTRAIGLISKTGRYGGTYAHKDIAFEFASWISPEFKLYLIQEFQRLKLDESKNLNLDWNIKRELTKINYTIHTDAIKNQLIPNKISQEQINKIYSTEADILNMALFGKTAKEWKTKNKNIRDGANISQLVCLSNLESINAMLINERLNPSERLIKLNNIAIHQMKVLTDSKQINKLTQLK